MDRSQPPAAFGRPGAWCALGVAVVVALLYAQYGFQGTLLRDDALYVYGAQRLLDGVPPYVGVFDHKGPLAVFLDGAGVGLARAFGADDLEGLRIFTWLVASAAHVFLFLLARRLTSSTVSALFAVALFAGSWGFGISTVSGPRAKTWATLFQIAALHFTVARRWALAGAAGSAAFLTWQPLAVLPVVTVALAALSANPGQRRADLLRALGGAAAPVAAVGLYFGAVGHARDWIDGMVLFNLQYLERARRPVGETAAAILTSGHTGYRWAWPVVLAGTAAALGRACVAPVQSLVTGAVRRDPWWIVTGTLTPAILWTLDDYQNFPDLYVFLPYAALGGAWVAATLGRRVRAYWPGARAAGWALLAVWTLVTATTYRSATVSTPARQREGLTAQRAWTREVLERTRGNGSVAAIGVPEVLVLSGGTNFSPYLYLGAGMVDHLAAHHAGGLAGWVDDLVHENPAAIVVAPRLDPRIRDSMRPLLAERYRPEAVGDWRVYFRVGS